MSAYIVGYEVNTPYGIGVEKIREGIISNVPCYSFNQIYQRKLGIVRSYPTNLDEKYEREVIKYYDRQCSIVLDTILKALENSKLESNNLSKYGKIGLFVGNTTIDLSSFYSLRQFINKATTRDIFKLFSNYNAFTIAHTLHIQDRIYSSNCACASSLEAITQGLEAIENDKCDIAICCCSEVYQDLLVWIFDKLRIYSSTKCNPGNENANGTIFSEGCGCIILANNKIIKDYNLNKIAKILGTGTSLSNSYSMSDTFSIFKSMNNAIFKSRVLPTCINCHMTGTKIGDTNELEAINNICKFNSIKSNILPFYKEWLGHTMAASGIIEICIPLQSLNGEIMLKNSFSLGGINHSIMIEVY